MASYCLFKIKNKKRQKKRETRFKPRRPPRSAIFIFLVRGIYFSAIDLLYYFHLCLSTPLSLSLFSILIFISSWKIVSIELHFLSLEFETVFLHCVVVSARESHLKERCHLYLLHFRPQMGGGVRDFTWGRSRRWR
ncbi:hypothetical protein I3760_01G253300 [Carya illinoinensis]|nr:hypothetical protein I3760_01G253300 [Carya illinoinensis]